MIGTTFVKSFFSFIKGSLFKNIVNSCLNVSPYEFPIGKGIINVLSYISLKISFPNIPLNIYLYFL